MRKDEREEGREGMRERVGGRGKEGGKKGVGVFCSRECKRMSHYKKTTAGLCCQASFSLCSP